MKNRRSSFTIIFICLFFCTVQPLKGQSKDAFREVKHLLENYQFDQAIASADQYLLSDSSSTAMLLLKGKALSAIYKYREARTVTVQVIKLDSTNIQAWFDLINIYRQSGNNDLAVYACRKCIALNPGNPFFAIQLSNLYYNADEFEKAKNVLASLYRSDTLNLYILKQLGHCYNELKMPDSAIVFYTKAIELNPSDAVITGKLINLYIKTKALRQGVDVSERYLALDSANTGILQLNGFCHYLLKDYPMAEQKFLKSTGIGDESRFTRKFLGLCYYKQDIYDKAEPFFRLALQMDTTDAEVCFYYGVSAYRSMLIDTGLIYLNKTLKLLMPTDQFLSSLYSELASAYSSAGRSDTAIFILTKAYETFPENKTLLFKIAYQYDYYLQQPLKALPYYKDFIRSSPELKVQDVKLTQQVSYYDYTKKRIKQIAP